MFISEICAFVKLISLKQLGKDPKEYPNANSMPSVQVALKLRAKGKAVKAKDVMSFIITGDSGGSAENAARNACTIEEVQNKELNLKPGEPVTDYIPKWSLRH